MTSVDTHTLFEYARRIQVNRYTAMNIIDLPNARETLAGAFVRLLLQLPSQRDDYVVARVLTIIQGEPYSGFSSDVQRSTRSCLQLELPEQLSEINGTIYQLNSISNSAMQESEFVRWFTAMRAENAQFSMTIESLQRVYERVHYFEVVRTSQQQQQQQQQQQSRSMLYKPSSQPTMPIVASSSSAMLGLTDDGALAGRASNGANELGVTYTNTGASLPHARSPATAASHVVQSGSTANAKSAQALGGGTVTTTTRMQHPEAGGELPRQPALPTASSSSFTLQPPVTQELPGRYSEGSSRTHVALARTSPEAGLNGNVYTGNGQPMSSHGGNLNELQRNDSNWRNNDASGNYASSSNGNRNVMLGGVVDASHPASEDAHRMPVGTQLSGLSEQQQQQQQQQQAQSRVMYRAPVQSKLASRPGHEIVSNSVASAPAVSSMKKSAVYTGKSPEVIDTEKERRMLQNVINTLSQTSVLFPRNVSAMKLTRLAILERDMSEYLQHVHAAVSSQMVVCVVCLDKSSSVITMPCKHKVLCRLCAPSVRTCPVCRSQINELFEVEEP